MHLLKRLLIVLASFASGVLFSAEENRDWMKNVKRANGEAIIENIPQVAQRGGYCVPSSIEMVLRYYGANYGSTRLGGIFRSMRGKGTHTNKVVQGFSKPPLENDFVLTPIYDLWDIRPERITLMAEERQLLIASYLEEEQQRKTRRGKIKKGKVRVSRNWDIETFDAMDPEIAKIAFKKSRANLCETLSEVVERYIDVGAPLSWGVFMNFDPNDKSDGGHWRVICGYNKVGDQIKEIIYRDSWGELCELKRVSLDDAATMTKELYVITPKDFEHPGLGIYFSDAIKTTTIDLAANVPLEMVVVPSRFLEASTECVLGIGRYKVTQKQYQAIMGNNPSFFVGEELPVENVTWKESIEFCKKLTMRERASGKISSACAYTLPRDSSQIGFTGVHSWTYLYGKEWVHENSSKTTHEGWAQQQSVYGIDIFGNIGEWTRSRHVHGGGRFGEWNTYRRIGEDNVSPKNNNAFIEFVPSGDSYRDKTIGFRIILIEIVNK